MSSCLHVLALFFFFQAEDGIRDDLVTGVQTCALPISWSPRGTRAFATVSANRSKGGKGPCSVVGISRRVEGSDKSGWLLTIVTPRPLPGLATNLPPAGVHGATAYQFFSVWRWRRTEALSRMKGHSPMWRR